VKKNEAKKSIRKIKGQVNFSHNKRIGFILILVTLILSVVIVGVFITPEKYNINIGELPPETITATGDIVDEITTERLREEAEESVLPVFEIDQSIIPKTIEDLSLFFLKLENSRAYAEEVYITQENEIRKKDKIEALDIEPSKIEWENYLKISDEKIISNLASFDYIDGLAVKIATLKKEEIEDCSDKLKQIVETQPEDINTLLSDESYRLSISETLKLNYVFSENLLEFSDIAINTYVFSNSELNEEKTQELKQIARQNVVPVEFKEGQNIVLEGEPVSLEQFEVLKKLGITSSRPITTSLYLSLLVYITLLFFGFYFYLTSFENDFFKNILNCAMLSIITIIMVLTAILTEQFEPNLILILFGTMMCAVLISPRISISFNVFFALIYAGIIIWNLGEVTPGAFEKVLVVIISGSICAQLLKNLARRATLLLAGLVAGFVGASIIFSIGFLMNLDIYLIALNSLWYIASCILCGVIAIGFLPLWESVFNVATPTKLLELSNIHHKLLQQLIDEAPGTYYHSSMVANLSENAAFALGSNALLVKTAAFYHDIGKLENPEYFTENQQDGNPHEDLTMDESAEKIIGHVANSVNIAKKNNIPREVINIMSQHHGNSLLQNFYFKAKAVSPDVSEEKYRYPFSKPNTLEAAILMLADTVEAAMRSQKDLPSEQKREKITALIVDKFNHGQLDDCPITRKDLGMLANIFTVSLENVHHNRIKYAYSLDGKKEK
jgi:cyclic-di-AMP phosphodiesterase PgpH